jgi:hypothetical protein
MISTLPLPLYLCYHKIFSVFLDFLWFKLCTDKSQALVLKRQRCFYYLLSVIWQWTSNGVYWLAAWHECLPLRYLPHCWSLYLSPYGTNCEQINQTVTRLELKLNTMPATDLEYQDAEMMGSITVSICLCYTVLCVIRNIETRPTSCHVFIYLFTYSMVLFNIISVSQGVRHIMS